MPRIFGNLFEKQDKYYKVRFVFVCIPSFSCICIWWSGFQNYKKITIINAGNYVCLCECGLIV